VRRALGAGEYDLQIVAEGRTEKITKARRSLRLDRYGAAIVGDRIKEKKRKKGEERSNKNR